MTRNRTRNIFSRSETAGKGNDSLNISQAVRNSKRKRPMRHLRTWSDKKLISQRRTFHAKACANGRKGTELT